MLRSYATKRLHFAGTRFYLDDEPFYLQGLSFFNALFNEAFNASAEARRERLATFKANGVTMLRVWCQWSLDSKRFPYADAHPEHTMFTPDGAVRDLYFDRLKALLLEADAMDMAIEIVLFSHECFEFPVAPFPLWAHERAAEEMADRLLPYRNAIVQIWNEHSADAAKLYEAVKRRDFLRIVANSPVRSDFRHLGTDEHNRLFDILTPHTNRTDDEYFRLAALQVQMLIAKYGKPVVDDEPARTGTLQFGGRPGTKPEHHIEQIRRVRAAGGYHVYHHDMFQLGYGAPTVPPSGIPDPSFSAYHAEVFRWLKENRRW